MKKVIFLIYILVISRNLLHCQTTGIELNLSGNLPSDIYSARDGITVAANSTINENSELKIDHSLLFDATYQTPVNPDTRQINTSLPVGTVKGIVDISPNGAATYDVPIFVSPGTNGMQPKISIVYNSQGANGLLGLGWDIAGLSAIIRDPQNLYNDGQVVGINLTSSDRFSLDGNRMICTSGVYGADGAQYLNEINPFARITSYGIAGTGPQWFKVETKEGLTLEYGNTPDSRIEAQGSTTVLYWRLNKVTDTNGNYINYIYGESNGESWITRIDYTGNSIAGFTPYNSIKFVYEKRADKNTRYIAGSQVEFAHILIAIRVECENTMVKEYKFKYTSALYSRLNEIIEYGIDRSNYNSTIVSWGTTTPALQTINPNYFNDVLSTEDFDGDGQTDLFYWWPGSYWATSIATPSGTGFNDGNLHFFPPNCTFEGHYLADLNGDAMQDVIIKYWDENMERFKFEFYEFSTNGFDDVYTLFSYNDRDSAVTGDFTGDGLDDFLLIDPDYGNWIMYSRVFESGALQPIALRDNGSYNLDLRGNGFKEHIKRRPIDFNGNGKNDILVLRLTGFAIVEYDGTDFTVLQSGDYITYYDEISVGDFNNDGYSDFFVFNQGKMFLSKGTGMNEIAINVFNSFSISHNYFYSIDINGDGFTDLVAIGRGTLTSGYADIYVSLNLGNNNFSSYIKYDPSESLPLNPFNYLLGDFNGDGNLEILYSGSSYNRIYNIYSGKENMLVKSITDGFNKKTSFSYKPMTDNNNFYTKGNSGTFPICDIQFASYMVSSISTNNGVGGFNTIDYKYEDSKVHRQGKGFLLISKITSINTTTGIKTVKEFGYNSTFFNSFFKKNETYTTNNQLINRTTLINNVKILDISTKRIFPYIGETISFDSLTSTTITSNYFYNDNYGNLTGSSTLYGVDALKSVVNEYNSYGNWGINNKIIRSTVTTTYIGEPAYIRITDYSYDTQGNLTQIKADPGKTKEVIQTFVYPSSFCGKPAFETISASDITSRTSTFTYDSKYRFAVTITNPLGHKVIYSYDENFGQIFSETDANNNTVWNNYDAFGRLKSTLLPTGKTVDNSLIWITDNNPSGARYAIISRSPGSPENKTSYDVLGRELQNRIIGFEGSYIYTDKEYYSDGNLKRECNPYKSGDTKFWTTYTYDNYKRLDLVTTPTCSVDYSYSGKTVTFTDCKGRSNSKTVNSAGDVVTASDIGGTITYTYHSSGQPRLIVAAGAVTAMTYNEYGRQTSITDPDAGTINYTYNSLGELLSQTNARSQTTGITYDLLGRIMTKTAPEGSVTYTYDNATHGKGMISMIEHSNGSHESYTYDDYSRLQSKSEGYDIYNCTTSYTYNNNNNQVQQMTYPSGFSVTHEYDNYGYLKKVKRTDDGTRIWECTGVNRYGEVTGATLGNGLTITRGYNQYGLPSSIQTGSVQNMAFSFNDTTGNLMWRKDNLTGRNFTEYFTYDNLDRLTNCNIGAVNYGISYHVNGNIALKHDAGTYQYSARPHAVTGLANSPITGSGQTIAYNSFNKPTQITEGSKNLYITYGVDNERIYSTDNSSGSFRERFYTDNYEEETTGTGTRKIHYIGGGDGLAAVYIISGNTGAMYYVGKDHLGNILLLTRQDGTVAEEYSYDAWGRRRSPSNWTNYSVSAPAILYRGYTGHEHLDEFGLINMNGRCYDPKIGRFLSPDNYVQDPLSTQGFNRYSYCINNPLKYYDPDGEWFLEVAIFLGFTYLMNAYNNRDPETGQWAWNPLDWFGDGKSGVQVGVQTNTSFNNFTFYGGINTMDGNLPAVSYNTNYGIGVGNANNPGYNEFYYPSINYNAAEQNAAKAIEKCRYNYSNEWKAADLAPKYGEIRQWNPNWIDRWSRNENFFGNLSYDLIDGIWISMQSFVIGPNADHMSGERVYGNDRGDAFVNSVSWAVVAYELSSIRFIQSGAIIERWSLRVQIHTHSLTPIKGSGASGAIRVTHMNINKIHVIFNPKNWKYFYPWWLW